MASAAEVLVSIVLVHGGFVDSGEPLNEPIVGHGPFVMNSKAQIAEAIKDFNSGRFGRIPPPSPAAVYAPQN
jgi:hypothetical protein